MQYEGGGEKEKWLKCSRRINSNSVPFTKYPQHYKILSHPCFSICWISFCFEIIFHSSEIQGLVARLLVLSKCLGCQWAGDQVSAMDTPGVPAGRAPPPRSPGQLGSPATVAPASWPPVKQLWCLLCQLVALDTYVYASRPGYNSKHTCVLFRAPFS